MLRYLDVNEIKKTSCFIHKSSLSYISTSDEAKYKIKTFVAAKLYWGWGGAANWYRGLVVELTQTRRQRKETG